MQATFTLSVLDKEVIFWERFDVWLQGTKSLVRLLSVEGTPFVFSEFSFFSNDTPPRSGTRRLYGKICSLYKSD
jgi:hypothetical protein